MDRFLQRTIFEQSVECSKCNSVTGCRPSRRCVNNNEVTYSGMGGIVILLAVGHELDEGLPIKHKTERTVQWNYTDTVPLFSGEE